jgi:hypothetical protein
MEDTDNNTLGIDMTALILGVASDLQDLRSGKISVDEGRVRADLSKQLFNGIRLMLAGQRYVSGKAKVIQEIEAP